MQTEVTKTLALLLGLYEYEAAYHFLSKIQQEPSAMLDLLYMLKERRELNIQPALKSGRVLNQDPDKEQVANYLLDLEAKLKKGQIIDFVRAVSPVIYRLFQGLVKEKVPDIDRYIKDSKDDRYDTWDRDALELSENQVLRDFRPERNVTSSSLAKLIALLDYEDHIQQDVAELRQLERSVRNPLAHLIKPFDEEELRRTTNFSSQKFLAALIRLAQDRGVHYPQTFYFDQVNTEILNLFQTED